MKTVRVAVGILAFARPDDLLSTLSSVMQLNTPNVTTYVLQSGMTETEFERVVAANPSVVALRNSTNLGAAGGRNRLIATALAGDYDYLCFLDSDAQLAPDALDILMKVYTRLERPGLVSCLVRVTEDRERVHSSGVTFDQKNLNDVHHKDIPSKEVIERDVVITTAAMISCDVLRSAPRLDERIFAYWEDVDWCLQLHIAGWKHYVVRDAVAFHSEARSRFHPAVIYYITRNHLLLAKKLGYSMISPPILKLMRAQFDEIIRRVMVITPLSLNCFLAFIQAFVHAFLGRGGVAPRWMQRTDSKFLEMWLYRFVFQRWIVPAVREMFRRSQKGSV